MGYLPVIRDDQFIQYGNRIVYRENQIKPVSPVIRGKFYEVMSEQQKQLPTRRNNTKNTDKKLKKNVITKEITGKGFYIDEVI